LEGEPKSVEDALHIAAKFEAIEASIQLRHQLEAVYMVKADQEESAGWIAVQRKVAECQAAAAACAALAGSPLPPAVEVVAAQKITSSKPQGSKGGHGKKRKHQANHNDVRRKCSQQDYGSKDCHSAIQLEQPAAQVEVRTSGCPSRRGWLQAEVAGRPVRCMIDLDTWDTVIGQAFVGHAQVRPPDDTAALVNGQMVTVVGRSSIMFSIAGHNIVTKVLVSPDVEGLVLGKRWYDLWECRWDMETGRAHTCSFRFQVESDSIATLVSRVEAQPEMPAVATPIVGLEPEVVAKQGVPAEGSGEAVTVSVVGKVEAAPAIGMVSIECSVGAGNPTGQKMAVMKIVWILTTCLKSQWIVSRTQILKMNTLRSAPDVLGTDQCHRLSQGKVPWCR